MELWNYVLNWGMAQTTELRGKTITNLRFWNEEDYNALKSTLDPFIKHIRFFDISARNFHVKIWPLRKVLPEALFDDLVSFHRSNDSPNRNQLAHRHGRITVDSLIIEPKHAYILANWIQRKDPNTRIPKDIQYSFNLIYRGSRDGYDNQIIRSKCHGHEACILVIKTKMDEMIIGGYNPCGWKYYDESSSTDPYFHDFEEFSYAESFIYTLDDGNDLNDAKISRIMNTNFAISDNSRNGPLRFGNRDLVIDQNTGTCHHTYYERPILDRHKFTIDEMEIFEFCKG
ncbi:12504_t:CDS:1 [Funneliformis mosseae]|uniref:12504_t:CDS:1 n=1 Tax=Funneliformis mosseae TaxID=27381 RepID=A0A9N9CRZ9_FUNMO|nr:12504_t:CDS:1 [Funneliformis mosseae]